MALGYYPNKNSDQRFRYVWWTWNWRANVHRHYRRNPNALPTTSGTLKGLVKKRRQL